MNLQVIGPENAGTAVRLLAEGFPARPAEFWHAAVHRLLRHVASKRSAAIGFIMRSGEVDAGVILTIPQSGKAGPGVQRSVNLSSWYVDQKYRWLAPLMLQKVVADNTATYTDLSPTAQVRPINERLGFECVCAGSMLRFAVPALFHSDGASLEEFSARSDRDEIAPDVAELLRDHAELGGLSAVLKVGSDRIPLVFWPVRARGLRGARVIYAPRRSDLHRYRGAIARFLLPRGIFFVEVDVADADAARGGLFSRNRAVVFAKGPFDRQRIDHAYSELVFLHEAKRNP